MGPFQHIKTQAFKIVFLQMWIIFGLAAVFFLIKGTQHGVAMLLGGLAYWVSTLLFVWALFARGQINAAKEFLIRFFAGEFVKLIMSAVLFLLIIIKLPVPVLSVLIGFLAAITASWASFFIFLNPRKGVYQ